MQVSSDDSVPYIFVRGEPQKTCNLIFLCNITAGRDFHRESVFPGSSFLGGVEMEAAEE